MIAYQEFSYIRIIISIFKLISDIHDFKRSIYESFIVILKAKDFNTLKILIKLLIR